MQQVIANIQQVPYRRLMVALILFWVPLITFIVLAKSVHEHQPIGLDSAILTRIHEMARPALDPAVLTATQAGSAETVAIITVVVVGYLSWRRWRRNAALLLFGVGGAAASNLILKVIFQRERPMFWEHMVIENGYSFPSGHAMASSALVFSAVCILWHTRWRWLGVVAGIIYMSAVGFSRLYLGVHYPSDVVAGWCVSLVWVLMVYIILNWGFAGPKPSTESTQSHDI